MKYRRELYFNRRGIAKGYAIVQSGEVVMRTDDVVLADKVVDLLNWVEGDWVKSTK